MENKEKSTEMNHNQVDPATHEVLKELAVQKVKDKMIALQTDLVAHLEDRMSTLIVEVLKEVEQFGKSKGAQLLLEHEDHRFANRRKSSRSGALPEKQFLPRNSLLTDLFEVKHIRTLYHIFIVILIIMFLNTVLHDIVAHGTINVGLSLILMGFGKFHVVLIIWLGMQASTFGLYGCFEMWAHRRPTIQPRSVALRLWDSLWLAALLLYQVLFIYFPTYAAMEADLPPASTIIVVMESIRFLMKTHAFVRTSAPSVLRYKPHTEGRSSPPCPGFSQFLYFLFAPTLVYRNEYPRTTRIRWRFVAWYYLEVLAVIFYLSFLFERFLIPQYRQFGNSPLEPGLLVLQVFGCMMPGIMVFLCGFYCLLHSWLNASAEALRFADRMFYKDWWNQTNYSSYYKTWNVVVHDWLYEYIYKDVYELLLPGNKFAATLLVFSTSAIFHEFILSFAFRFFYPVMLVMFGGFGALFMFISSKNAQSFGNICMWLSLVMGNGIMLSMYVMEFFARLNCPTSNTSFVEEYLVPRSWSCPGLTLDPDWTLKTPWEATTPTRFN